jgi:hypothetical protein
MESKLARLPEYVRLSATEILEKGFSISFFTNISANREPMNPAPPVINKFTIAFPHYRIEGTFA